MIELIDTENRIAASSEVPASIARKMPEEEVTIFYVHQTDWLVLNKSNKHYDLYRKFLKDYLALSDWQRKEILEFARKKRVTFFNFINQILRIRRRWERCQK